MIGDVMDREIKYMFRVVTVIVAIAFAVPAAAEGIVAHIVNSPVSAAGLVRGAPVGVSVLLQSATARGIEFMDPNVVGHGVAPGGRVEVELVAGFERIAEVPLSQDSFMAMTGAPQQGLHGKAVGYTVDQGGNENTYVLTPTKPAGLPAPTLLSPAPGAKGDPVRQRGIKLFHVGLLQSAFRNTGASGAVAVRFLDSAGRITRSGHATVDFIDEPVPQIHPNNFPDGRRAHDWQVVKPGQTVGIAPGTLPLPVMLFAAAKGVPPAEMDRFTTGILGVGVVSVREIQLSGFQMPAALARYNGGLILRDANGDGRLDPKADKIIGGVIGRAPAGAGGMSIRSLRFHGAQDLSRPSAAYHSKFGDIFGGAVALLQFTAGDKPGLYRPTLALLSDPEDLGSPDGSSYTYTILVK